MHEATEWENLALVSDLGLRGSAGNDRPTNIRGIGG